MGSQFNISVHISQSLLFTKCWIHSHKACHFIVSFPVLPKTSMLMYNETDVYMSLLYLWTSLWFTNQLNWRSWDITISDFMLLNLRFSAVSCSSCKRISKMNRDWLFYVHMPYHPWSLCQINCITLIQLVCRDWSNILFKCQQYICPWSWTWNWGIKKWMP